MKTIYLNFKTSEGVETVDEFTLEQGQTVKEFKSYVNQMVREYHLSGCNVYKSSRPTKVWAKKS